MEGEPPSSLEALAVRYRRLESRRSPDGAERWLNWAVVAGREPIGFVQATVSGRAADVAYVIGRRYQGSGSGTRAVREMLVVLAEQHCVSEAHATVDARNEPSLRLLATIGFVLTHASDPCNLRFSKRLTF
jgi:ribosomal-protein-alanine N-acetyltransferase